MTEIKAEVKLWHEGNCMRLVEIRGLHNCEYETPLQD
eukprot:CAMPEP_0194222064 /NCGR_PEP_ID=MMETSP0156-20130528/32029_1 /TAXON_ID=33649 /ORGANISM="Thalassionema nitzschioides, Strain L26-B" /LENGTH=36 /DNA_ID= /DNA_START= /DNA_END= /DNA_ORIENTATION=